MRRFKVGILGCGVISRTYVPDIQRFYKELDVCACSAEHIESAQRLAEEFHIPKVYAGTDILNDDELDIIVNLTPPLCHAEMNKKIILAGKHLFSEKPFAFSLQEAQELAALAEKTGVMLGCAPDTFLGSGLQSMRYYLDAGLIGTPFAATANMMSPGTETWHTNPAFYYKKGGGPLWDMGPYYLSAIVALLGPVESVAAFSAQPDSTRRCYVGPHAGEEIRVETATHYTAILRLVSGAVVSLNMSFDVYRSELPKLEMFGDGGTLAYPDPNFGGGTPRVYRKEQFTDTVYQQSGEATERSRKFYELPELFPRVKDYSRGVGVLDLAKAIDSGTQNRTNIEFVMHITEALEGIGISAETGSFYRMTTTCERPRPITPGGFPEEL